jgi:hypothetical protein
VADIMEPGSRIPRIEPPRNLQNVIAIHDGARWLHIQPASLDYCEEGDSLTFSVPWAGQLRRYTMAAKRIYGYQEIAPGSIRAS